MIASTVTRSRRLSLEMLPWMQNVGVNFTSMKLLAYLLQLQLLQPFVVCLASIVRCCTASHWEPDSVRRNWRF
ncbi:MAG: hypothetical protein R3B84_09965 [Zavarzinella sp.]